MSSSKLEIQFQNEDFIAVDKPAGWLTTPARFGEKDPRPVLGLKLQEELGRQIYPVHRLDYEVSGLVLYALNAKAHSAANSLFESKAVQKTYQAFTENRNPSDPPTSVEFEWKARVLRGKKRTFESPHGKPSLTRARCLGRDGEFLKWELKPVTGRSHQLRFDLSRHGFPIRGDVLYGATPIERENFIYLRSLELAVLDERFCEQWNFPKQLVAPAEFFEMPGNNS